MSAAPTSLAPAGGEGPTGLVPEPPFRPPSARAVLGLLLTVLLLASLGYTGAIGGFAHLLGPLAPAGTPVAPGSASEIASELLGQNISNASLFWLRPSLTDWSALSTSGSSAYGPTDPALLNATREAIAHYGLGNATVPIDLVSPSESGLDPDLTPGAVLVQIPRVAAATHLSDGVLVGLVDAHTQAPALGLFGPTYVNVIVLDLALLTVLGS